MADPIAEFRAAMCAAVIDPPAVIEMDGALHRFSTNGRPKDDAGWYVVYGDGIPAGAFGDFRSGVTQTWRADIGRRLSPAEEQAHRQRMAVLRQLRAEEEKRRREEAQRCARAVWAAAGSALADHAYLERKAVSPTSTLREMEADRLLELLGYIPHSRGEALVGRILVAPIKVGNALASLEFIDGDGRKSALFGGAKKDGYWAAQKLPDDDGSGATVLIGEGVATMLSARQATGHLVVAALSCGNLEPVARMMQKRYAKARIVILADLGNGQSHAEEAARAVGAHMAIPNFGREHPATGSDFNDMLRLCGADAVRRTICDAAASAFGEVSADCPECHATAGAIPDPSDTRAEDVANDPAPKENPSCPTSGASIEAGVSQVSGVQPCNGESPPDTPADASGVSEGSDPAGTPIPRVAVRPAFRVLDDWLEHAGKKFRPGVWHFGTDKDGNVVDTWICSPLHIDAVTFDGQDNNFGRLLRFRNTLGRWREWAMPMEMLSGLGNEVRAELLAMGVEIDPGTRARNLLASYLQARAPKRRMRCALQVGWCDGSFVLPDAVIGPRASGVIFQSGERGHDEHTLAGTLEGWQSAIAARASGNPLLTLALSASFAGPMLNRCNAEGGGLHFEGDSSTGKTTLIEAACSTWGGPGYRRSWRATANGMEGAAALFNDCLLALDEISECDPREVGIIVYALGNGRGKQRASRTGAARGVTRWRCFVLSSGERSIGTHMQEGGRRAKAGQSVRLLDIPAVRRYGAWDDRQGLPSGAAFSDAIKRATATHHGHAGRAFLERLARDDRDFCALLERVKALREFAPEDGEGQDKRAAARLALVALAGELATEYGVTGWPEGEAVKAAAEGFRLWRAQRGSGNDERRQILEQVEAFIGRHGDARFSNADCSGPMPLIRERAGWWRDAPEGRIYLFTADGLREALGGFEFSRALDALVQAEVLPSPGADGKHARFIRIGGQGKKLYTVQSAKLEMGHGA